MVHNPDAAFRVQLQVLVVVVLAAGVGRHTVVPTEACGDAPVAQHSQVANAAARRSAATLAQVHVCCDVVERHAWLLRVTISPQKGDHRKKFPCLPSCNRILSRRCCYVWRCVWQRQQATTDYFDWGKRGASQRSDGVGMQVDGFWLAGRRSGGDEGFFLLKRARKVYCYALRQIVIILIVHKNLIKELLLLFHKTYLIRFYCKMLKINELCIIYYYSK